MALRNQCKEMLGKVSEPRSNCYYSFENSSAKPLKPNLKSQDYILY